MADILVIDDDVDSSLLLAELFRCEGHDVRVAHDGRAGLAEVDRRFPDLLVLDVEMPVLDGPAMARELVILDVGREQIPIVLVSGYLDLRTVARGIGTPYVLPKPCPVERILATVGLALVERTAPCPGSAP